MKKQMTLSDLILKHKPLGIQKQLACSHETVYAWLRGEIAPSYRNALKLISLSKGKLDFNAVYSPFVKKYKRLK